MRNFQEFLHSLLRPSALFELAVLWAAIYFCLRFLRGSLGLGILRGLLFLGLGLYFATQLLSEWLGFRFPHLETLLQPSLTILIIGLIVVFQPEIRRGFTRVGTNPAFERLTKSSGSRGNTIADAVERLSHRRIGALIAIERSVGLRGYTEGAIRLNAEVSSSLLESMFQPGGPLHDGAVLIRGDRIVAAGCLFPLTENPSINPTFGTRHRAAIGVTEESDALAIVVSEETGNISLATNGEILSVANARELAQRIDESLVAPHVPGEAST